MSLDIFAEISLMIILFHLIIGFEKLSGPNFDDGKCNCMGCSARICHIVYKW